MYYLLLSIISIIKVSVHQQRWLAGGYDLEIGQVDSMVVSWWIVVFVQ